MKECLTKPLLLNNGSGCLVEYPACGYAEPLGFSFICRHPEHEKFQGHRTGRLSRIEMADRYEMLREKRRDRFVSNLLEEYRGRFVSVDRILKEAPSGEEPND